MHSIVVTVRYSRLLGGGMRYGCCGRGAIECGHEPYKKVVGHGRRPESAMVQCVGVRVVYVSTAL